MSELTKSWLTVELLRVKSGYADWAVDHKTIWPQWSWERLGALAMCAGPQGSVKRSLPTLMELADKRLKDAVVGEIVVRLGVKPWQIGHFRHLYTNKVETTELINLRALTRLGAVRNEADLLAWSLRKDGVGEDLT